MLEKPYFLSNSSWYKKTIINGVPCIELTDKAPDKARQSYTQYFRDKERSKVNG